jgi:hypothetical protein
MRAAREKNRLDDVLNEYVQCELKPSHTALEKWIKEYPEYKKELVEFTVSWTLMTDLSSPTYIKEVSPETLLLRAMSIVEDRLYAHRQEKIVSKPLVGDLLKETKSLGLTVEMIASKVDMSAQMVTKLARRHISYPTIPDEAINRLSAACQMSKDDLILYFQRPIVVPQQARFSAKSGPKAPSSSEDFFDAVRNDRSLDNNQRVFWLSFERKVNQTE